MCKQYFPFCPSNNARGRARAGAQAHVAEASSAHLDLRIQHAIAPHSQLSGRTPRQQTSPSRTPRQSSHPGLTTARTSPTNSPSKKTKKWEKPRQRNERGQQWSRRRAWRKQWDHCKARGVEATRRRARHGTRQQPGHGRHRHQLEVPHHITNPPWRAWRAEKKMMK